MVRVVSKPVLVLVALAAGCLVMAGQTQAQPQSNDAHLLSESFDNLAAGTAIGEVARWEAFRGFNGKPPAAVVREGLGRNGSRALAVSHDADYRCDVWGVTRQL